MILIIFFVSLSLVLMFVSLSVSVFRRYAAATLLRVFMLFYVLDNCSVLFVRWFRAPFFS